MQNLNKKLDSAAEVVSRSKYLVAFTGAGISVESGIPPFRGADGLWSKYDPMVLELSYFYHNPLESWKVIKEIFYDFFGKAAPNKAHLALARLEQLGILKSVITQNIDNLHQLAGNTRIFEFHGNSQRLICTNCNEIHIPDKVLLENLPPLCASCNSLLKPDFIFFGEQIPMDAYKYSIEAAEKCDVFLIIGSTGEVSPANQIPSIAKRKDATIIEINPEESHYTSTLTDIYLCGRAVEIMQLLMARVEKLIERN
ncbi:MAG: NAD-dependent deacylase [Bacteroidales bacterium]|jgi:NAD-dependent deacetylase|nr:NAD-dependent deacylase [Bacteroidales bacterium]MDI9593291.1 NAD-dependent deacylase [Bacteroidota bacterium]MBP7874596.1 NAD-dependent deacylase [Bacteroidales bacterium]MCO6468787.1 NAD-dependent deacylase [Bacteroidales bacterium]MCZ2282553.1 NAD-dependent deacylase [Bacteroidales bacterium]